MNEGLGVGGPTALFGSIASTFVKTTTTALTATTEEVQRQSDSISTESKALETRATTSGAWFVSRLWSRKQKPQSAEIETESERNPKTAKPVAEEIAVGDLHQTDNLTRKSWPGQFDIEDDAEHTSNQEFPAELASASVVSDPPAPCPVSSEEKTVDWVFVEN